MGDVKDKLVTVGNLETFLDTLNSKKVYITQERYDQLVEAHLIDPTVEYNIYEDDN